MTVGGTKTNPGDIVILDADVPAAAQEAALKSAAERVTKEEEARERYRGGALTYDLQDYRAKVEGSRKS